MKVLKKINNFIRKIFTPLGLILLGAFLVRVVGIDFGFPHFLHPDETKIIEPAITMAFGLKEALRTGNLHFFNPEFFFYPSFLIYFETFLIVILKGLFAVGNLFSFVDYPFTEVSKPTFYFFARLVSVFLGTATVYLIFKLGENIKDKRLGLSASALLAFTFLHVKNSHYYTGDVPATFFVVLSFFFLFRYLDTGRHRLAYLTSLFIGLGVAVKYYPALMILPLVVVLFLKSNGLKCFFKRAFFSGLTVLGTFIAFTPFSVLDHTRFIKDMTISSLRSSSGIFGYTSNNFFYYFLSQEPSFHEPFTQNSLQQGLGLTLLIFSVLGLVYGLWKGGRKIRLIILYAVVHYIFFASHPAKIVRWLLPLVPLFVLLSAYLLTEATVRLKRDRMWRLLLILGLILPSLFHSLVFDLALTREDTRARAFQWTQANIEDGSRVVFEYFSIHQFLNRQVGFYELIHPRYNIDGAIEKNRPPEFEWLAEKFKPDYIILNDTYRGRFSTPSSRKAYPKASRAWLQFYDKIDEHFVLVKSYGSRFPENIRPGPGIKIYEPKQ